MKLSRASAIAVFAVASIAESRSEEPRQGRELAEVLGVPADSLLKVLQQLVRSGILISSRGRAGGFRLARPSDQITLLDVVEAVDGELVGELAAAEDIRGMTRTKARVESVFGETVRSVRGLFGKISIKDLANHSD